MFTYVQGFMTIVFDVFCCKVFFKIFGTKKYEKSMLRNAGLFLFMIIADYSVVLLLDRYFIVKQIVVIILFAALMAVYFKINIWKAVILAALFQEIVLVADFFALMVTRNMGGIQQDAAMHTSLAIALGKAVLLCTVLAVRKIMGKHEIIMMDTEWLRFLFFPAFTICIITAMLRSLGSIENLVEGNLCVAISCGLVAMNIFAFYLVQDIIKRETQVREEQIYKLKVKNQVDMYRSVSENFDKQRKKAHEYNNQIVCMESLIKNRQYDALEKFIGGVSEKINTEIDFICTNHVITDAILNTKYQEFKQKDIAFVFKLTDLSELSIADEDVVVILSNLLNNAMEACEKCKDSKVVKMKFVIEDENVFISVRNTYENAVIYENGKIQTTKKINPEDHGMGIKNVVEAVTKYGGSYTIENDEKEFYFSIRIPMTEK